MCLEASDYGDFENYWEIQQIQAEAAEGECVNISYDEGEVYDWLFYGRGATFLKELCDTMGKDAFVSALSDYCQTYAYKIATTEDFINTLDEHATVDISDIIELYIKP